MPTNKLTVAIPTYNSEGSISRLLDSIINETDLEIYRIAVNLLIKVELFLILVTAASRATCRYLSVKFCWFTQSKRKQLL